MSVPGPDAVEPSLVEDPDLAGAGEGSGGTRLALQAHSLRAPAGDPRAFVPGNNAVPPGVDAAFAEEALATLSTVERADTLRR